nr:hypothetical protein [Chloroflexota bacterium]
MTRSRGSAKGAPGSSRLQRALRGVLAAFLAAVMSLVALGPVLQPAPILRAASPEVAPASGIRLTAEPMLDGHVRPGTWSAVRVRLEN